MILKEIINNVDFIDIWEYLTSIYEDYDNDNSMASHFIAFEKIKNIEPIPNEYKIKIEYIEEYVDDIFQSGWKIDGIIEKEEQEYALDFTPWNKWLGMEVETETLNNFKPYEIAAHCLWEMTYFSFDENKTQEKAKELNKMIEEINDQVDNPEKERIEDADKIREMGEITYQEMYDYLIEHGGWQPESVEDLAKGGKIEVAGMYEYQKYGDCGKYQQDERIITKSGEELISPNYYGYIGETFEEVVRREYKQYGYSRTLDWSIEDYESIKTKPELLKDSVLSIDTIEELEKELEYLYELKSTVSREIAKLVEREET